MTHQGRIVLFILNEMEKHAVSLRNLADMTGVSTSFLSRFLREERGIPNDEILVKIGVALNIMPPTAMLLIAGRIPERW